MFPVSPAAHPHLPEQLETPDPLASSEAGVPALSAYAYQEGVSLVLAKVLGFARTLGASIGAERRRQEAARQEQEAERVRQVEVRQVEQERQAAELRALRERTAAEQVWARVQAEGELARQKDAEKAQQKAEQERPAVTQRPRGPSMSR